MSTYALGGAADGRVTVSSALQVGLDLLTDLSLHLVRAAGHQVFTFPFQTCQALLKTGDLLHYGLQIPRDKTVSKRVQNGTMAHQATAQQFISFIVIGHPRDIVPL